MSRSADWSRAYARQADADFRTWSALQAERTIPECHKLLFLQMACEKLVKAYLCRAGSEPADLRTSHAYTAKILPIVMRQQIVHSGIKRQSAGWIGRHVVHLAREIELLGPSVRAGGHRLDNCEYPWEDAQGRLHVPVDWSQRGCYPLPPGALFSNCFAAR